MPRPRDCLLQYRVLKLHNFSVYGDSIPLMYNITELDHTINYTISVAAINCAGTGGSVDLDIIAKGNNFVW